MARGERTGRTIEVVGVDGTLVRVEVVRREEHGEERPHAPVLEDVDHVDDFLAGGGRNLKLDERAIGADDTVRGQDKAGRGDTEGDDDQECNVRRGRHSRQATGLDVDREGDSSTEERTELEDGPEDTEGLPFVLLERVGHHDGTLGGPEERSRYSEHGTGEDEEPAGSLGLVAPQGTDV